MAFPNATVLANGTWQMTFGGIPPNSLLSNIQTIGLLNNTLYDILTTTDPSFTNATVNATSLQANCGLLSNLTFYNTTPSPILNFSVNDFDSESFELYCEFFKWSVKYCELYMVLYNPDYLSEQGIARNQIDFTSLDFSFQVMAKVIIIIFFCNIFSKR